MENYNLQYKGQVSTDWIDSNGHMNVKSYFQLFENACWSQWKVLSKQSEFMDTSSMVAGRFYIEHRKELFEGDRLEVWSGFVPFSDTSIMMVHRIKSPNQGVIATCEVATCFFDLKDRKQKPFPDDIIDFIGENSIQGLKPRLKQVMEGQPNYNEQVDASKKCCVVIFIVDNSPNHVGLYLPGYGIADLSLIGSRIYPLDDPKFPSGTMEFYPITLNNFQEVLNFLQKHSILSPDIIAQERKQRGWHLTKDAPNHVLKLRDTRSIEINDMNCVEWIARALEIGGQFISKDILTPENLRQWCMSTLCKGV